MEVAQQFRVGQGLDLHRLVDGRPLILGGVRIPYARGLEGHSDADVLLHAVTDAVLGAAGLPDIGQRFPNTDETWRGASSLELLRLAWSDAAEQGWRVENIDCCVLAESPKLSEFFAAMRQNIGRVLGCSDTQVCVKATTPEKLGALGRSEGIAAMAVALLSRRVTS